MDIYTMLLKLRSGEFLSKAESIWLAEAIEIQLACCNNSYKRIKKLTGN